MADGSIMIARSMPAPQGMVQPTGLGFMPPLGAVPGNWLMIDTVRGAVNLMEGDRVAVAAQAAGAKNLRKGRYQLVLKQRNPLWYAPSTYFEDRNLEVPPEGDKNRFRRGALGDFVLYLDKETPVHSGPVWNKDIGGIKLDEASLAKMYYLLSIGSMVEVR